eukprot:3895381-Pyramimonas_sp.AAC.1
MAVAQKLGWGSFWTPVQATESGFPSGGVAIILKSYLAVRRESGKIAAPPGRVPPFCCAQSFG